MQGRDSKFFESSKKLERTKSNGSSPNLSQHDVHKYVQRTFPNKQSSGLPRIHWRTHRAHRLHIITILRSKLQRVCLPNLQQIQMPVGEVCGFGRRTHKVLESDSRTIFEGEMSQGLWREVCQLVCREWRLHAELLPNKRSGARGPFRLWVKCYDRVVARLPVQLKD